MFRKESPTNIEYEELESMERDNCDAHDEADFD